MVLTKREQTVLNRTVERYIKTGEPVASRQVAAAPAVSLSPATVRNVMADLEDSGYLDRSHPSAGCVPTDGGFRVYVDSLNPVRRVAGTTRKCLTERIGAVRRELFEDLAWVPQLVAEATREAGVAVRPMDEEPVLEALSLVPLVDRRVLGVIVTDDGCVERRVLELPTEVADRALQRMANLLVNLFAGRSMGWIRDHELVRGTEARTEVRAAGGAAEELGVVDQELREPLAAVARSLFGELREGAEVLVAGTENLLLSSAFEAIDRARSLMVLFNDHERIVEEWRRHFSQGTTRVIIGRESEITRAASLAMVATLFYRGGRRVGALGVVGPRRMDYRHIVPIVEFIGEALTEMLDGGVIDA
jgi:heat-inducible transcriptional repressor